MKISLKDLTIRTKILLSLVSSITIIFSAVILIIILNLKSENEIQMKREANEISHKIANKINGEMIVYANISRNLAAVSESYKSKNRQEIIDILKNILEKEKSLFGIYSSYEPFAFDNRDKEFRNKNGHDSTGAFIPYWIRKNGELTMIYQNDYSADYYTIPKKTKAEFIMPPYIDQGILMTSFLAPIIIKNEFVGIAGVDVGLNDFSEIINKIKVMESGYVFLLNGEGKFITFKDKSYLGKTLEEFGKDNKNERIIEFAKKIKDKKETTTEAFDPILKEDGHMFYTPLSLGNWGLVIITPDSQIDAGINRITYSLILTGIVAVLIIIFVGFMISGRISRPIIELLKTFNKVFAMSDKINAQKINDEVSLLSVYVNDISDSQKLLAVNLFSKVKDITAAAAEVLKSSRKTMEFSENLSNEIQQVVNSNEDISSNMNSISSASQEMGSSVKEISSSAGISLQISQEAAEKAEKANIAIRNLSDSSKEIGNIIKVITSIAEETNLLALNATIEAARAGEMGKGFAVVASEVKDLAKESAKASEDIEKKITAIQNEIHQVTGIINEIFGVSMKTRDAINTISAAIEEQTATVSEISISISSVSSKANTITGITSKISSEAGIYRDLAGSLKLSADELENLSGNLEKELKSNYNL